MMLYLYKRLEFTEHLIRGWKGWKRITLLSNASAKRLGNHHQFHIFWLVFVFHCSGNPVHIWFVYGAKEIFFLSFLLLLTCISNSYFLLPKSKSNRNLVEGEVKVLCNEPVHQYVSQSCSSRTAFGIYLFCNGRKQSC